MHMLMLIQVHFSCLDTIHLIKSKFTHIYAIINHVMSVNMVAWKKLIIMTFKCMLSYIMENLCVFRNISMQSGRT